MFKTVKSKILITAIIMLAFLMSAFMFHTIISRMKTKQLMVQNYGFSINEYVEDINDSIIKAEDNLKSLSLIGSLFYKTDRSTELTDKVVTRIFENYPNSLGGGIWFKPYILDKNKKYVCFYAFRNKNNKIILDKNFASKEYDYPNQDWYKQIISQVTPERNIVWSKPYYENLGSYTMMVTAGTGIYVDGELVGIATVDWELSDVIKKVSEMKPLEKTFSMYDKNKQKIKNSFALLGNLNYDNIIATNDPYLNNDDLVGHSLKEVPWYSNNLYAITYITYHGKKYVPFYRKMPNGMVLVICIPKSEMFKEVDKFYLYIILALLLIGFIIPALLYLSMNRYIINPIDKLINIAHKISKGEDIEIKIENPEEFAQLASTFDKMTKDIKSITRERAKINSELSIAKSIQASSLPSIFPPFPDKTEFDIFASMEAAKEVGGDFYDFFFINETQFMFLIADVSGKGIPAALFMMTVKTLINNLAQIEYEPKKLIENVNRKICETNKQGLFVTMLTGIIDINTGKTSLINCGHNLPLMKRADGNYEYLQLEPNIPLGVFEDAEYQVYETVMNPGDIIYTYTDGITEATTVNNEVFGETRLFDCLNSIEDNNPKIIAKEIRNSIMKYTDSAPQSDDITMLIFKFNGNQNNVKTFKQAAIMNNYNTFYTWLHDVCKEWNINDELTNKLDMCAEEIYANITFYAYPEKTGKIEAELRKIDNNIVFEFKDEGVEYNPLEKPDPDINLPPEERPLGGLGIFMVKEMANEISYRRENNKNILTLIFKI
ncbi:SpoIIE family protein phosphatase [bacterium]|nr:SpoIIE family protein phosphatase [bacterium]